MGMPINSVSAASASQANGVNAWQQRQQDFKALSQAMQSGDLAAAQQAFSSLSSSLQGRLAANPDSPLAKVGQALQSGDMSAAQAAFSEMRSHHHHHGGGVSAASQGAVTTTGSVGGTINVQA